MIHNAHVVEELEDELEEGFFVGGDPEKSCTIEDDPVEIVFENNYAEPPDFYISIRKINNDGKDVKGASLQLYMIEGDEEVIVHNWTSKGSAEEFQIEPGTYYIREIEAPEGYILLEEDVEVVVPSSPADGSDRVVVEIEVKNIREWDLEKTGGTGTKAFYIAGAAVVLLGAGLLIYGKKYRLKNDQVNDR